jgi:hypothetical protein
MFTGSSACADDDNRNELVLDLLAPLQKPGGRQ